METESISNNHLMVLSLIQQPHQLPTSVLIQSLEAINNAGLYRQTELVLFDTQIGVQDHRSWFHFASVVAQRLPDDFPNKEGLRQYIDNCAFNGYGID